MNHNSNIAKNIKLLRLSKELTIKQFAEKVNIGVGIYGFYETERASVPLDNLIKIANFHSVKLDDLVNDKIGKQLIRKIVSIEYRKQKEVLAKKKRLLKIISK